ncbi:MAG: CHC2 zinc finger domain-containing protein [Methylococcaceae bacterium]|nr:CHC2 zinc finger domain-containing protein [Methylococcaceae bacterium]
MNIDQLLARLEKIRRTGDGKWLACCPAHNDKNPSLAIKQTDDGEILIHCFAGCDVESIVSSIDLSIADLMPDNPTYKKGSKPPKFNKYELFDRMVYQSIILCIAIRQLINKEALTTEDQKRVLKAEQTIDDIARECRR